MKEEIEEKCKSVYEDKWTYAMSADGHASINKPAWFGFMNVVVQMEGEKELDKEGVSVLRLVLAAPALLKAAKKVLMHTSIESLSELKEVVDQAENREIRF